MPVRPRLVVGNWKMNKTATEARQFVKALRERLPEPSVEVVMAPPFTAIHAAGEALAGSGAYVLAAQNLYWEDRGAFTGEVSAAMIKDLGCRYVIIGHSERRQWFGETDAGVNKKIRAALRHELRPIVCVGESLSDREQGRTESVITEQIRKGLDGLSNQELSAVTLAYEPVWAIGTGRAASPEQAAAVHGFLRRTLIADRSATVGHTRILYGGSVTPENAEGFFASSEVDGALVGGSCLDPHGFATIIELASR